MTQSRRVRARDVDAIVLEVTQAMVDGRWTPELRDEMAVREGVGPAAADDWAKQAGRLLRIGPDVELYRGLNLRRLDEAHRRAADTKEAVAAIAEQNKMLGLHAPQKLDVSVVATQYEAMPREGKIAWLRERAARALREAERLEAIEVPALTGGDDDER